MPPTEKIKARPQLSILAIISFIASFGVARTFTILYPHIVLTSRGFHIHHFWYGLALLAIGGWLGISYDSKRISRLAAILFGTGGGLIGDEVGFLLTLGNYWTGVTYTFIIIFLALVSTLFLLSRYSRIIRTEFTHFLRSNASLYFGVFLAAVSIAFITETDNAVIITASSVLTITACVIILNFLIQRIRNETLDKKK
jgi:hypothetical protein